MLEDIVMMEKMKSALIKSWYFYKGKTVTEQLDMMRGCFVKLYNRNTELGDPKLIVDDVISKNLSLKIGLRQLLLFKEGMEFLMAQSMTSSVPLCESLIQYFIKKPTKEMNDLVGGFRYFYGDLALKAPIALSQADPL
jgi:hypothetical protein